MHRNQPWWTLLAVVPAFAAPTAALCQASFELGPIAAIYTPVGRLNPNAGYSDGLPMKASDLAGVAWGVQGRVWLTPKFGVQLQGAATSSRLVGSLGVNPGGRPVVQRFAQVVTLTAEALYNPVPTMLPFWLSVGAGVVRHGGDSYAQFGAPSPLAAVLGVGFDVHIGRHVTAALGAKALFYSLVVEETAYRLKFDYGTQTDVLTYVVLGWRSR